MTMTDIETIEARHRIIEWPDGSQTCEMCGYRWPCDTEVMRRERDKMESDAAVGRAVLALEDEHTSIIDWYPNDRRWRVQKFSGTGSPSVGTSDDLVLAIAIATGDDR
jgi:hypothetical protein